MGLQLDLMPLEEKLPEAPAPKTIVVKYGFMKEIGEFPSDLTTSGLREQVDFADRSGNGDRGDADDGVREWGMFEVDHPREDAGVF